MLKSSKISATVRMHDGVTGFRLLPFGWMPFRGLGSEPGCLWEDSIRTPPKPPARSTCKNPPPFQRPTWRLKPPQDASKTPPNRLLFGICFSMPFWIHFLSIFHLNLAPTWPPKSPKIHEKSMPRCLLILTSFFDRFLIDVYSKLRPPEPSKSLFS